MGTTNIILPAALGYKNTPFIIDQDSNPITTGAAGATGTYSQTGFTVTTAALTHGLSSAHNGYSIYLNCTTGTGGAGLFTNFQYISATAFTCTSTTNQTTSGNCALAATATNISMESIIIPGGSIGNHGSIRALAFWSVSNTGNTKTLGINLGGTVGATGVLTGHTAFKSISVTTVLTVQTVAVIMNRSDQAKQCGYASSAPAFAGSSTLSVVTGTINTSINQILTMTGNAATAGDIITLEGYVVEIMPG